jgi:hypothetical protein
LHIVYFFFALPVRRFCVVACYASFAAAGRQSYRLTTYDDHRFTVLQEFIARNGEVDRRRRRRHGWAGDIFFFPFARSILLRVTWGI